LGYRVVEPPVNYPITRFINYSIHNSWSAHEADSLANSQVAGLGAGLSVTVLVESREAYERFAQTGERPGLIGGFKFPAPPLGVIYSMPWECFSKLTAEDAGALYEFLHSVPAAGQSAPEVPTVKQAQTDGVRSASVQARRNADLKVRTASEQ
jgi:hypothetical protein